mgnify:CR=1 FL=1
MKIIKKNVFKAACILMGIALAVCIFKGITMLFTGVVMTP